MASAFWSLLGRLSAPPMLRDQSRLAAEIRGKVVLVTGASYGLGAAIARMCGDAGAVVVMCARSATELSSVAGSIRAKGGIAHAYPTDLADERAVRELAARVLREHGHVDVLLHNAGKSMNRAIHLSYRRPKDLDSMAGVNYLGPVRLTLALLPYMRERRSGHIINISTAGVLAFPAPRWGFYLSTKKAFEWWLRSLAPEIRSDGIACTQYYLGHVYTRMSAPDRMLRRVPGQAPDDAALGVGMAMVRRPRSVAFRPLYLIYPLLEMARWPVELLSAPYSRIAETTESMQRAVPQVSLVLDEPGQVG
ncbi:MAG TPA: SDR family NAD(P)-dependent oxidoreductase [Pseudonocardia sp.]|jgi:NAD(P)-dependent dehydrogenase (short-subunit alcohol dehydrogenase family)|nr:SDR family NAD(P)-dependent oxidoreductase [Pseudonocardia sp.]